VNQLEPALDTEPEANPRLRAFTERIAANREATTS
jgi:hypothetical protein